MTIMLWRFCLMMILCSFPLIAFAAVQIQSIEGKDHIKIPINLQNPDGSEKTVIFLFDPEEEKLEFRAADFCEQNNIRSFFCRKLFELAYEQERLYKRSKYLESTVYPELPQMPTIPNSHLLRNPKAIQAEIINAVNKQNLIGDMLLRENLLWDDIKSRVDFSKPLNRISIIHSCLFANQTTKVLEYLFQKLTSSALISELDYVVVFHYGIPIPRASKLLTFEKAIFIHVSNDSSLFEVPTLRLLHRISTEIVSKKGAAAASTTQLLYMHTKGVSYSTVYSQIEDWVNMMLHFLVEKHRMCYHLLASDEFDAIGLNYCTHPRMFSGNFYWVTAEYVSNSLLPLQYEQSNKYDAEYWLFRSTKIRVYIPHISNVFHASQRYPRYCYAAVAATETPSLEQWIEHCQEDNQLEYEYLHGNRTDYLTWRSQLHNNADTMKLEQMASGKITTGRCRALELYKHP